MRSPSPPGSTLRQPAPSLRPRHRFVSRDHPRMLRSEVALGDIRSVPEQTPQHSLERESTCLRARLLSLDQAQRIVSRSAPAHEPHRTHDPLTTGRAIERRITTLTLGPSRASRRQSSSGDLERRRGSFEAVEHHQSAFTRELFGPHYDRFDMRRMQNHDERLALCAAEPRDLDRANRSVRPRAWPSAAPASRCRSRARSRRSPDRDRESVKYAQELPVLTPPRSSRRHRADCDSCRR